eukprot:2947451-Prymnesium_polylepis.1
MEGVTLACGPCEEAHPGRRAQSARPPLGRTAADGACTGRVCVHHLNGAARRRSLAWRRAAVAHAPAVAGRPRRGSAP